MIYDIKVVQDALNRRGYFGANGKPLVIDGLRGMNTNHALVNFKQSVGLSNSLSIGPLTWALLVGDSRPLGSILPNASEDMPWYVFGLQMMGKHEIRDNRELSLWLRSDGRTIGDPSDIAWCGDYAETSLRRTIPDIVVPSNPYLAANWSSWGQHVAPQRGCILSFWRGSPDSWKGHVGFYAGESEDNFYVLGGNQNNMVSIAPLSKKRLRKNGSRWPDARYGFVPSGRRVQMTGGTVSTNES